jgi:hypothetical protein
MTIAEGPRLFGVSLLTYCAVQAIAEAVETLEVEIYRCAADNLCAWALEKQSKKIKRGPESCEPVIAHQYFASSGVISIMTGLPSLPPSSVEFNRG